MIVNPITNGIVLDHIKSGKAMEIYKALNLDSLETTVAIIKNAESKKMGRKDILKIFEVIDLNFNILGYIDPGITVSVIKDGKVIDRKHLDLPEEISQIIKCKNPRCITSTEQELVHKFRLTDRENGVYRCIYCETKAK